MREKFSALWEHPFFLAACVLLLTALTHGWNVHSYPSYMADEGTYTSQAWWLIHFRELAPYTYWYDHPPLGWAQLGLWQLLTGGPFMLGFSLHSTRIFMVIVAVLTNLLVYSIVEKLTHKRTLGLIASLLFAVSPLMVIYHRLVILDNLATVWLLLSMWLLLGNDKVVTRPVLSGIAFGLAFLSKETAIFFLPVMIYAAYHYSDRSSRTYAVLLWVVSSLCLIIMWPLLALLRGELFPASAFPGDKQHVSLVETVLFQLNRPGGRFWELGSDFRENLNGWLRQDPFLLILGAWAVLLNLTMIRQNADSGIFGLLSLSYLLYLMRGGVVFNFYIAPLLSLLAINIALAFNNLMCSTRIVFTRVHFVGALSIISPLLLMHYPQLYTKDATFAQKASIDYVREHIPVESTIVVDNVGWMDLRLDKAGDGRQFPNVQWFWKVDLDPDVQVKELGNDWRSIEYVVLTFEMLKSIQQFEMPLLEQAFDNSWILKVFAPSGAEQARDAPRWYNNDVSWAALLSVDPKGISHDTPPPQGVLGPATAGPWTVQALQPRPLTVWPLVVAVMVIVLSSSVAAIVGSVSGLDAVHYLRGAVGRLWSYAKGRSQPKPRSPDKLPVQDEVEVPEKRVYDVVLSFAGEDRYYAESLAQCLIRNDVAVFYDEYEQAQLWGKDLYEHLTWVYKDAAQYCVMFISENYAEKLWTNHERKSAQARAFEERKEYILPARLDDTEIPGVRPTVGYVDLRTMRMERVCELLLEKLGMR